MKPLCRRMRRGPAGARKRVDGGATDRAPASIGEPIWLDGDFVDRSPAAVWLPARLHVVHPFREREIPAKAAHGEPGGTGSQNEFSRALQSAAATEHDDVGT